MVKFKQTGHRELVQKLRTLDRKMQRSISGKALRAEAKITVRALRAAAPRDTGAGARALGTKVKTYRGSMVTVAISGERSHGRRGKQKMPKAKYGGPHFHLIEQGTGERFHTGEKKTRATLIPTGAFGKHSVSRMNRHGRAQWSRTIRDVQSKIKKQQSLSRREQPIAADIQRGRRTGKVQARPFFKRAWQGSIAAGQAAKVAVLKRELESAARAA